MLKEITIGQYIPGDSFIHKLDPRTKILLSILFIACLFLVDKFVGYTLILAYLVAIIIIAKVPLRFIFNGLKPIFLLVILTAILNIFMVKGTVETLVFKVGIFSVYTESCNSNV